MEKMITRITTANFKNNDKDELQGIEVAFSSKSESNYITGSLVLTPAEVDAYGIVDMRKAVEKKIANIFKQEEV